MIFELKDKKTASLFLGWNLLIQPFIHFFSIVYDEREDRNFNLFRSFLLSRSISVFSLLVCPINKRFSFFFFFFLPLSFLFEFINTRSEHFFYHYYTHIQTNHLNALFSIFYSSIVFLDLLCLSLSLIVLFVFQWQIQINWIYPWHLLISLHFFFLRNNFSAFIRI